MPGSHRSLVKRRLLLINAVIVFTSVIGILSILEVSRGVGFHESNIQHLGLTSMLQQKIMPSEGRPAPDIEEIRHLLIEIRKEPDNCLATRNPMLDYGTRILGTDGIYRICQRDTNIIGEALAMIPLYQAGELSETEFLSQLREFSHIMHQHSFEFRPLITRTVNVLLIIAGLILILKGLAVTLISIFSSRSIMRQFQNVVNMQAELRKNNDELETSVTELQHQKIEIVEAQKLAEYNARHDTLTGLPNRRYLNTKLAEIKQGSDPFAILHIDIDGFKQINDTRGHKAGDYILEQVARRLESIGDEVSLVARVGGDEFVLVTVFQQRDAISEQAESLAVQVVDLLQKPVTYQEFDCRISASVGIAIRDSLNDSIDSSDSSDSSDEILVDADLAMYHQKLCGKNGYAFYDLSLRQDMNEKKLLADEIHRALEVGEFIPFYQSQVESSSFKITGVEALVRWEHPTRGILTPDKFLHVATDMGVLGELDRMVFEKAHTDFMQWDAMQLDVHGLSVNMSLNRLVDPLLMNELEQYDLSHGRVSFELVESILLDGCNEEMQTAINRLEALGIQMELDDFGSGHASILGLLALKPKRFKIDRQLVSSICTSSEQRALIGSIIDIGKSVKVKVVAEGVETLDQAQLLREMGCEYLQGYYFSKPIGNEEFIQLIRQQPNPRAA